MRVFLFSENYWRIQEGIMPNRVEVFRKSIILSAALYIFVLAVCLSLPDKAEAVDNVVISYSFEMPAIKMVDDGGEEYAYVSMPSAANGGNPGEPALPSVGARILIPAGREFSGVEVRCAGKILLGRQLNIAPIGPPVPLSKSTAMAEYIPAPNPVIYNSDDAFPPAVYDNIGIQRFRGYDILILKLNPVELVPASGELYYYPEMEVIVSTIASEREKPMFRGFKKDMEAVAKKIDNPETIKSFQYLQSDYINRAEYDLLILTNAGLVSALTPLKDYHDGHGVPTEIHAINEIANNPDAIRDYIRDAYLNDGIEYVLIAGDDDIIAAKDLYVEAWTSVVEDMPTDLYFGCLDGTYNFDGDGRCGEPGDGDGGGEVDLTAEVYVGRAAVGNSDEATRFVNKTLQYLNSNNPYIDKVLLCGEDLGDRPAPRKWAGEALDKLIDGSDASGYTTIGFSSIIYDIETLYDRDWPGNDWPESEIISRINNNVHCLVHLGHCNEQIALTLHYSELDQFTNSELCFLYSQGCLAGHFDNTDCWAEYMTIKNDYGAFAAIMNARLGWTEYWVDEYSTDGPSQRYMREFWDAVLNPAEDLPQIGKANHDSKEDNIYRINEGAMRWCCYETNLFGDPAVSIKRPTGINFEYPFGLPTTVVPEQPTPINVNAVGLYGALPVPGTGQLHYIINSGELQTVMMSELAANEYEAELPAIACGDEMRYYFSVEELMAGRMYYPDPESPYLLLPVENSSIMFEDDFETDKGWAISGLWARGIPIGAGSYGYPDPTGGCDGPNLMGYNLNGDYENDLPETHLISPAIDCGSLTHVFLNFQRWLAVDDPAYGDHASISVSNDGANWTAIWTNGIRITDQGWIEMAYDISEVAAHERTVYIRWTMGETNSWAPFCGWNIDAVQVSGYECHIPICGDADGDATINILDIVYLINYIYKSGPTPEPVEMTDVNHDESVNILDIVFLINYVYKSGPEPVCL